ncbi:MAG: ATP-grasp domain-containing protein [Deltaproteobacteria bacterium]|nr:ATP-grasp domain-containing protein [Deltaproteobacteria bacterium]
MTRGRVLVLGDEARATLAVIRSLGRAGVEVHWAGRHPNGPPARSRYVARRYPIDREVAAFVRARTEAEPYDLIIPTTDEVAIPLDRARGLSTQLALPSPEAFRLVQDKARTTELCRNLGIPVPEEVVLGPGEGAERVPDGWPYPLVVKPVSSFTASDLVHRHQVETVSDRDGLVRALAVRDPALQVVVQQAVPGVGGGLEILAYEGEVLFAFQHRRLHEPARGGGSSLRESVPVDPLLAEAGALLARALRYTGVAMLEIREHEQGFTLLEINGRFWGSLPLAIAAGADFPRFLYEALVEGRREFDPAYRIGVVARNLGRDLGYWAERARREGPSVVPTAFAEGVQGILHGEASDTFAEDDPAPALLDLWSYGERAGGKVLHRLRSEAQRVPFLARRKQRALKEALQQARRVLFLCKGNLARSPFAAHTLEQLWPGRFEIRSAGFKTHPGRRCPPEVLAAAQSLGIDLQAHRSTVYTPELSEWADLTLVFDEHGRAAAGKKGHDLSIFAPPRISDPYGKTEPEVRATFLSIQDALAAARS